MKLCKNHIVCLLIVFVAAPWFSFEGRAQRSVPRDLMDSKNAREAIRSGVVSEEDVQKGMKAVEEGEIDPEVFEKYKEKAEMGSLTPEEIRTAKELFEDRRRESISEREDVVYLYGNVMEPGEYDYKKGMAILDILPDTDAFKKNTFFGYALIKRFHIESFMESKEIDKEDVEKKKKKRESLYTVTPEGKQVELITFELGKLYYSGDESHNIELKPRDEIYIFHEDQVEMEEKEEKRKEFFQKGDIEEFPDETELEIFGRNLFGGVSGYRSMIQSASVSDNYLIGPGDELSVLMWGRLNQTHNLEVDNEGLIHFPRIGTIPAAGMTFAELKEVISHKAEAITGVQVSVSMGRLKTIQVFALGEVERPGMYPINSLASISSLLFACGGPTRLGSMRNIQLKRNGEIKAVLDLYDFLLHGDMSSDIGLMTGDVVFIPQAGPMVGIMGNVKREAVYELKGKVTPAEAVALAGGLKPGAYDQRIQIERSSDNESWVIMDVSLDDLKRREEIYLKDGDRIRIFSLLPESVNAVYLYGNVERPGKYAYSKGLRLNDVLPDLSGFKKDTDFQYALVKRYRMKKMQAELIPFNPGEIIFHQNESENIFLEPRDEIYIFNKTMFKDSPEAVVRGEIRNPGTYKIDDMKIRDLILKAGGVTDEAYMKKGELIRIDANRDRRTIYFDIAETMKGDPDHNLTVQHEDELVIHSILEKNPEKYVSIKGEINKSGRYRLSRGMRLTELIFKAGGLTQDVYMTAGHLYRTNPETKEVVIKTFNLDKAMEGDLDHDPVLEDMDEVLLHSVWDYKEKYTVRIEGLVRNPGEYPYAVNMTVGDLISISGNVRDAAFMDEAELVRVSIMDGREVKTSLRQFNIRKAQAGDPEHDIALKPMDVVTIKEIPQWWEKKKSVSISGEVYFPGVYQIRKEERLSDVIKRAGGFTGYAYLDGAVFTRESIREIQQERIDEMMQKLEVDIARLSSEEIQKSLSPEDLAAQTQFMGAQRVLLQKLRSARATGRVVINLMPLEQFIEEGNNMVLENGDTLHVPKTPHTVNVIGAVYNPTALIHEQENPELQYYLDLTGGPTENADEELMYVIRANGTVVSNMSNRSWWKKFEKTKLDPGDTIIIPEKVITTSFLRDAKDISQILYQIAVTAGVTVTQIF